MLSIINTIKNKVLTFINGNKTLSYYEKLNKVLISQTHNPLFYQGNIGDGGKALTKEVTDSINSDRCSLWLYNKDKTSIVCEQLYIKSENKWYNGIELFEKDFKPYFDYLKIDPIIIANNAEKHTATSCFTEPYLKPLGVKSMLDVPIIYRGEVIGVICIESLTLRKWKTIEIHFAQILSSLYTFAYSVKETNKLLGVIENKEVQLTNRMDAINRSNAVIEFDLNGNIKYANKSFLKTMGYNSEEIVNKHHSIFVFDDEKNSDSYVKFWDVLKSGNFFSGEIIRKKKDGSLVYLRATYNPILDEHGNPYGVMKIAIDITLSVTQQLEIENKNTYLEHAAKIIRHDMHSGINTYIPRGVNSLERRLTQEDIKRLKIESPLKLIKDGLLHAQKVYRGVYEFTNLVKKDAVLTKTECNIKVILKDYLSSTAYLSQVLLDDNLPTVMVNESLFCTAIDNLIRNGLKYNDSDTKFVKIYYEDGLITIQDNGRGMTQEDFNHLSKPYTRKEGQKESGTGLGLNICVAILKEHGFRIDCDKNNIGTKITIKIN
jgi:PAS domain S-box-containing protein